MADNYPICLIGAMDRLWFHQIIIFSESTSLLLPKILKPPKLIIEESSITYSSSNTSQSTLPEEDFSSIPSAIFPPQDDNNNEDDERERSTRKDFVTSNSLSNLSSPLTKRRPKKLRYLGSVTRLQKTMSCKSLLELELEEVKGFMDLGFRFDSENLCPRMMSVLPGLQRIGGSKNEQNTKFAIDAAEETDKGDEIEEEDDEGVMRPYLSEAWIKRPDSPLLNLRIPKVSAAADMKRHLRYWARTVASIIQQES